MIGNVILTHKKNFNGTLSNRFDNKIDKFMLPNSDETDHHNLSTLMFTPGEIIGLSIMSVSTLVSFLGNIISTVTILRSKILRQNVYYWFVLNLSIVDLLVTIVILPLYIVWEYYDSWPFSPEACGIVTTIDLILSDISVYSKLLIAFDKFMLITRPLTYNGKMSGYIATVFIATVWAVCIAYGITSIYGKIALDDHYTYDDFIENCVFIMSDIYTICTFCVVFLIPFIFLTYTGVRLFCLARHHQKNIAKCHPSTSDESTSTIVTKNKRHTLAEIDNSAITKDAHSGKNIHASFSSPDVLVGIETLHKILYLKKKRLQLCRPLGTVTIVIVFFVIMCAPYWIVTMADVGCSCVDPWIYEDIFTVFYNMNSLVNPYIYIFTDKKYRKEVKKLLKQIKNKCLCCKTNISTVPQTSVSE
ncbi:LOW QUALITY PROTEIN: hypothetical protein KUTeg_003214 [Tegillarca granosa]|uniref:G-protein coupled receptors family 1 profile domain-containing protein n=1 Tax=Tegillarca granosa TaxID=220873 RepID=A0ABQ9FLH4_TEGGR|nr:LOW QUALITY PROTEIN: hypothetical protein KUTeg_003214 [Tegillarca granosa]